ncbi:MAG: protein kinase [Zoogloeaceae bacterium]|jgi:nucleotide-binding universal stress UspA family protein|nr:protein kinase [Zoogloeaceae bacterium]
MARPLEPGARVGNYRIESCAHAGSMAMLYRVSGPDAGFPLLMKVPRFGHGEATESIVGFEVEQMILAALKGPHVPRFVEAGDLIDDPHIVMEWVDGRCLAEWSGDGPVPANELARLGAALATAAHSLHLQEAIHLDIKPLNVMIRPGGEAVLVDFGLSHHAHFPDLLAEEMRRPIGSPPYLAPEQVVGVRCDPRSDIFSIGVALYELATGKLPFGAPETLAGMRRRLWADPVPPRALTPALPEWLQEIILRCIEVDPVRRYPSAAHLAFDLTHPEQVTITERGRRTRTLGFSKRFKRWLRAAGWEPGPCPPPTTQLAQAPIVLVAVATRHTNEAQFSALRAAVRQALALEEETRLACVTVIRPLSVMGGATEEESASAIHLRHQVQLRHWAEPLRLSQERVSFHVLEAADTAEALVDYAIVNHVNTIVIGAPPPDMPGSRVISTVATRVVAEAPCTVTVVRAPGITAGSPQADTPGGGAV